MEQLDKIVIGWVTFQSLGIGGLIWRSINLFFDVKNMKAKMAEQQIEIQYLEAAIDKKFEKLEEREAKVDTRFEEIAKNYQEVLLNQALQQSSLDQIKDSLKLLTNQLLEKKTDSAN